MQEGIDMYYISKITDPKFSSQTKDKLVSSEVRPVIESTSLNKLEQWIEENPSEIKKVLIKLLRLLMQGKLQEKQESLLEEKQV